MDSILTLNSEFRFFFIIQKIKIFEIHVGILTLISELEINVRI